MGQTIAEKIISAHVGRDVKAGELVIAKVTKSVYQSIFTVMGDEIQHGDRPVRNSVHPHGHIEAQNANVKPPDPIRTAALQSKHAADWHGHCHRRCMSCDQGCASGTAG